jgi:hypothetical protein
MIVSSLPAAQCKKAHQQEKGQKADNQPQEEYDFVT